ncbi:hypothetical protein OS242_11150 [Tumebacillus sp. DT12]|uniref:Uncharacterized protein n=1 Tax=Tumebacillus lacus TaxID=2995335 RepID=A0ABT3X0S8_9BACL|nr:hypothetical protein [Tumebacillus lacus]MCX7570519.1 hypothetical protein [Tumebacillus lacus]
MITSRIKHLVSQGCWGLGYYRDAEPIRKCLDDVLTNWPYTEDVQVVVTPWAADGCHLHTKVLAKIGTAVYPLILSETFERNLLNMTQNDITHLLAAVIEETEEELSNLKSAGVEVTDPLAAMLQEMEQMNDNYHDTRE